MSTTELTAQQQDILKAFRAELVQEGVISGNEDSLGTHEDRVLLRFLRARKFNIKNAKTMIVNCIKWRETVCGVGIDELYKRTDPFNYPEQAEVLKYWPIWYHKTDKKGRALNIQSFGSIDTASLFKAVIPERHWETLLAKTESMTREVTPACSVAVGRIVDDVLCIVDVKGFSVSKFWQMRGLLRDSAQITQDYYPETMGHLAVINAPYSFAAVWAAVRPWLAKETQEKVHILSSDYQSGLLELVDAENLPASLGGKCTCEGFGGCEASQVGPWMLDRERRRDLWLRGDLERAGLSPGNKEDVELVREGYGKASVGEGRGEANGNADTLEDSEKSVNRDVLVTETPVSQGVEGVVN